MTPSQARLVLIGSSVPYVTYNLYSACIGRLKGSTNSLGKGCHGNDPWILQSAVSRPPLILKQNDLDSCMSLFYSSALFPNSAAAHKLHTVARTQTKSYLMISIRIKKLNKLMSVFNKDISYCLTKTLCEKPLVLEFVK